MVFCFMMFLGSVEENFTPLDEALPSRKMICRLIKAPRGPAGHKKSPGSFEPGLYNNESLKFFVIRDVQSQGFFAGKLDLLGLRIDTDTLDQKLVAFFQDVLDPFHPA